MGFARVLLTRSSVAAALIALVVVPGRSALRFDSELIRMEIRGDTLRVDGLYRFLASDPRQPMLLFYPYPVDSLLGTAWTESLVWRPSPEAPWQPLAVAERPQQDGVRWRLPTGDGDRVEARTVYCQLLRERYARYIVISTQAWGRPLREARFELTLPPGMQLTESSFPFVREGDRWVYEARDFMPSVDVIVRWGMGPTP
jgi:hypothetical protein